MRATVSAGMMCSTRSRQAKTTNVAYAPNAASATIHQMCQISANPMTAANAHGELRDLQDYPGQDDRGAAGRDQQPWTPTGDVVVLHATGHSHEAHDIERHEGDVEAGDPAPERGLAQSFVQPEAECFRK